MSALTAMLLISGCDNSTQQDSTSPATKLAQARQLSYESPEAAYQALYEAVKTHKPELIYPVLGPGSAKLIYTGDEVADQVMRDNFITAYDTAIKIETASDTRSTLLLGDNQSPFPFPLLKDNSGWHFDVEAGAKEIINRRIGENELFAIKFCLAYGDAQNEYAEKDRNGNGLIEYAQRFSSSEGKYDGLYWPAAEGTPTSPLGPLVIRAKQEGYTKKDSGPVTYHGYQYKILTGQGKDAPGGAYDYIIDGNMIGGYALVAYPAQWGSSGVMSFICNHDGLVYQKNLGEDSVNLATKMSHFNPDESWSSVPYN